MAERRMHLVRTVLAAILLAYTTQGFAGAPVKPAFSDARGYQERVGTKREVTKMPRRRAQGALPLASALVAGTLMQRYICHVKGVSNCASLQFDGVRGIDELAFEISPLGMTSFALPVVGVPAGPGSKSLRLSKPDTAAVMLSIAAQFPSIPKEACFDFDSLSAKYGGNETADEKFEEKKIDWDLAYAELKYVYEKNRATPGAKTLDARKPGVGRGDRSVVQSGANAQAKQAGHWPSPAARPDSRDCIDCELVNRNLLTDVDQRKLRFALQQNSFGAFLYTLIFTGEQCELRVPSPRFMQAPEDDIVKQDLNLKIKRVIDKNFPIALDSVCINRNRNAECTERQALVIAGYMEACNDVGTCRTMYKVYNSYGIAWQQKYENGWLDADSILENLDYEGMRPLSWYEY